MRDFTFRARRAIMNHQHDDVLRLAGIDEDDEAEAFFLKRSFSNKSSNKSTNKSSNETEHRPEWRQLIQSRIRERVTALACSQGITIVDQNIYEFLEDALQVRLKQMVGRVSAQAARRNDANDKAFSTVQTDEDPKQGIRTLNAKINREEVARQEFARQALLRVGANMAGKRAVELPQQVITAQQAEDERIRADLTNQAARNAMGASDVHATYLKWATAANNSVQIQASPTQSKSKSKPPTTVVDAKQSIVLGDCAEAIKGDVNERQLWHAARRIRGGEPDGGRHAIAHFKGSKRPCADALPRVVARAPVQRVPLPTYRAVHSAPRGPRGPRGPQGPQGPRGPRVHRSKADILYQQARRYQEGLNDRVAAARFFREAANALGVWDVLSKDSAPDLDDAVAFYREAAERGREIRKVAKASRAS